MDIVKVLIENIAALTIEDLNDMIAVHWLALRVTQAVLPIESFWAMRNTREM